MTSFVHFQLGLEIQPFAVPDCASKASKRYTTLLPRYVNVLTICNSCPFTVKARGPWASLCLSLSGVCAGWCNTSVFFMLMVSPKALHSLESLFMLLCMVSVESALRAQSSTNRKSQQKKSWSTLVSALSLARVNSPPPYVLQSIAIAFVLSWKAIFSKPEIMILNSVGARTQPCLTPLLTLH